MNAKIKPQASGRSPWRTNWGRLKVDRKEAKRRYERGDLHRDWERENYRLKHGIPLDAPIDKRGRRRKLDGPNAAGHEH